MVDLMMTNSVEDILQWSNTFHNLCVDPELIEKIELLVNNSVAGRDEERHGQVERLGMNMLTNDKSAMTNTQDPNV